MASVTKQRARRSKNVIDWNLNIIIKVTRVILCYWNAFELDIVSGYPSRGGCPTSYTTLPASRCGTALHVRQRGLARWLLLLENLAGKLLFENLAGNFFDETLGSVAPHPPHPDIAKRHRAWKPGRSLTRTVRCATRPQRQRQFDGW